MMVEPEKVKSIWDYLINFWYDASNDFINDYTGFFCNILEFITAFGSVFLM
jgi:hypothetical protein